MIEQRISRRTLLSATAASAVLAACGRTSGPRDVGVAVVGIGNLTLGRVLPALEDTEHCYLAGLLSSSPDKMREVGERYGVSPAAQYTYDDLERIADDPAIDFVYIAVPNALHAEFAIRAARAGKHVLCEKPLATTAADAEAMIAASNAAGKYLAVAYRLLYSAHHQEVLRIAREQTFGQVRRVRAEIGFGIKDGDWRLDRARAGGGVLLEQGVYAVHAARRLLDTGGAIEVLGRATAADAGVDESVAWTMTFPDGAVAECEASYTKRMNRLRAEADDGFIEIDPAFNYDGLKGHGTHGKLARDKTDQFVAQLDDLALRIKTGIPPEESSGAEGLKDARLIDAIYESIRTNAPVTVGGPEGSGLLTSFAD